MFFRLSLVLALMAAMALFTFMRSARAEPDEIHYAPPENLERLDVALIGAARERIDLAAFDLTDRPVIDALIAARRRGWRCASCSIRTKITPSTGLSKSRTSSG